jgi:hypothetical protein
MKNQWTPQDQAELDALQERKAAFEAEARKPLDAVVMQLDLRVGLVNPLSIRPNKPYPTHVSDLLMRHADALREALKPFGSGIRCGSAGE